MDDGILSSLVYVDHLEIIWREEDFQKLLHQIKTSGLFTLDLHSLQQYIITHFYEHADPVRWDDLL